MQKWPVDFCYISIAEIYSERFRYTEYIFRLRRAISEKTVARFGIYRKGFVYLTRYAIEEPPRMDSFDESTKSAYAPKPPQSSIKVGIHRQRVYSFNPLRG